VHPRTKPAGGGGSCVGEGDNLLAIPCSGGNAPACDRPIRLSYER
jgi:hypothetical protein